MSDLMRCEPVRQVRDTRAVITMRELVEWTYATQQAHRGGEMRIGYASISQTGLVVERLTERLLLGCMVDRSFGGAQFWGETHCDGDALAVHGVVESMPHGLRAALIHYGSTRGVPDWQPRVEPLRVVPVAGRKGAYKGIYDRSGHCIGCCVSYDGDVPTRSIAQSMRLYWPDAPRLRCVEDIQEHARRVYSQWWEALAILLRGLPRLLRWRVVGIGAPCEPWVAAN